VDCARCEKKECYRGKDCSHVTEQVVQHYATDREDLEIAKAASMIEGRYYGKFCRLDEIIAFSREMNFTRLGIAFCIGLAEEARMIQEILDTQGFDVSSVCCKVCGIMKDRFAFEKIDDEAEEAMCNPVGQAEILNQEGVELNIAVGLCIGHDILFHKHSRVPVTTFMVKDRVLAHNPAGAIYSRYYRRKWKP